MPEQRFLVKAFKGLNVNAPSYYIDDHELSRCRNFELGFSGELINRTGWACPHDGSSFSDVSRLLGFYITDQASKHQLLAATDTHLFYSNDAITWTEILVGGNPVANAQGGVQYNDKFYVLTTGNGIYEWDGVAATHVTGSPDADFGIIFKERMFTFKTAGANGSRVTFSDVSDVSATGWGNGGFLDCRPGDGDFIVAMAVVQDTLLIFKMNTTFALYVAPDPADWTLRIINREIGCTSKYACQEVEGYVYFVAAMGVYRTDGITFDVISNPVSVAFTGRKITQASAHTDALVWWNDRIIVALAPNDEIPTWASLANTRWADLANTLWNGSPPTKEYWVYYLRAAGWTQWDMSEAGINPFTFVGVRASTPDRGLYAADADDSGRIFRLTENNYADNDGTQDVAYTAELETKTFDFGIPTIMKRMKWVGLHRRGGAGQVDFQAIVDGSSKPVQSFSLSGEGLSKAVGPGYGDLFRFNVKMLGQAFMEFHSLTCHMHVKRGVLQNTG